jgi:hypothetical protein
MIISKRRRREVQTCAVLRKEWGKMIEFAGKARAFIQ